MPVETKLLFVSENPKNCAWYINDDICSDAKLINIMKTFLQKNNNFENENKKNIVKKMKIELNCKNESCILLHPKFKNFNKNANLIEKNLEFNFKPEGPLDNSEWLSNFNIDETLKQFEILFKDQHFLHIPFQMRDFVEKNTQLNKLDIYNEYQKGIRTIGTVMNIDYSHGNGIHWFSTFIDLRNDPITIEYFNSSGDPPLSEFHEWYVHTKYNLSKKFDKDVEFINVALFRHQEDSDSCGIYSIYYIFLRLNKIPFTYFQKYKIPYTLMYNFRKHLFRDNS